MNYDLLPLVRIQVGEVKGALDIVRRLIHEKAGTYGCVSFFAACQKGWSGVIKEVDGDLRCRVCIEVVSQDDCCGYGAWIAHITPGNPPAYRFHPFTLLRSTRRESRRENAERLWLRIKEAVR